MWEGRSRYLKILKVLYRVFERTAPKYAEIINPPIFLTENVSIHTMSLNLSQPLPWNIYLTLMQSISTHISTLPSEHKQKRYAAYQLAIAAGCQLGLTARELLILTWQDIMYVRTYTYKKEPWRKPKPLEEPLCTIIQNNYNIIQPEYLQQWVLTDPLIRHKPLASIRFNMALKAIFQRFDITVDYPSALTLRKTYAYQQWIQSDFSTEALSSLALELGLNQNEIRRMLKVT